MRSSKRYLFTIFIIVIVLLFFHGLVSKLTQDGANLKDHYVTEIQNERHSEVKTIKLDTADIGLEDLINAGNLTRAENLVRSNNTNEFSLNLSNYIDSPAKLSPFNFRTCRMSNCFNFSRCESNEILRVSVVPSFLGRKIESNSTLGESNQIHKSILKIIRESVYFEPDADKACLFVLEDDTLDRDPLSQSFVADLPPIFNENYQYGMNFLVFNLYSGTWPDYKENDFAGLQFGAAILAKASNSESYHRPGFDISLPLFSYLHPFSDNSRTKMKSYASEANYYENRTFFLTFKGKRYVFGKGSETRNNLYHINNERDVLMLTTCRHGKKWREASDSRCSDDELNYDRYDFNDLLRESTFCLIPRGRRLGSFRFLEALSYGCIPVILSDNWVKPFDEIIDWSKATVQFEESLLLQVPDILRDIDQSAIVTMRKNCLNIYDKYFSTTEKIILTVLRLIEGRIRKNKIKRNLA